MAQQQYGYAGQPPYQGGGYYPQSNNPYQQGGAVPGWNPTQQPGFLFVLVLFLKKIIPF